MGQQDIDERRRGEPSTDRQGGEGDRAMTSAGRSQTGDRAREGGPGGWSGYVVPYRYYGPGYRGVGYYSVMYHGPDDEGTGPGGTDTGVGTTGRASGETAAGAGWSDRSGTESAGRSGFGGSSARRGSSGWIGGHAGRGPKGYQRSDDRLREDVSDLLMADDQLDASEIEVSVKDGEVTLVGTVEDRWAKRRAEDLAEQAMGVRDVMNQIRVQPSRTSSGPSGWGTDDGATAGRGQDKTSRGSGRGSQERNGSNRTTAGNR